MGHRPMSPGFPSRASSDLSFSESLESRSAHQQVARVAELRKVHDAFAWFRSHARELEDLQLEVTSIPAPGWGEAARSAWLEARFRDLALTNVHHDELGNVFAIRPGADPDTPYIAVSAHIDTVFPAGTPIDARRDAGKLYGPGISDNS